MKLRSLTTLAALALTLMSGTPADADSGSNGIQLTHLDLLDGQIEAAQKHIEEALSLLRGSLSAESRGSARTDPSKRPATESRDSR